MRVCLRRAVMSRRAPPRSVSFTVREGGSMRSARVIYLLAAFMLTGAAVYGQRLGPLVNGVDFSGSWYPGRHQDAGLGTAAGSLVDYGGFPINEALRMYA